METDLKGRCEKFNPLLLAYMGDAYFETLAREYLIGDGNCKAADLNACSHQIVTAASQSAMLERLLPYMTEKEVSIYKRGRNAKSAHRAKSASVTAYRRATGLECLYGYFWLSGQHERAKELFLLGVSCEGR